MYLSKSTSVRRVIRTSNMFSCKKDRDRVVDLVMLGPTDGARTTVAIDVDSTAKELLSASAVALQMKPSTLQLTFCDCVLVDTQTLWAMGFRDGALYEARVRDPPPELEEPKPPKPPRPPINWGKVCKCVTRLVLCSLCVASPYAVLPASCYWLDRYQSTGCRMPVCDPTGHLQCCTVDRFGGDCVPAPELLNISCAAWQRTERDCQAYKCKYTKWSQVQYETADDSVFEGLPTYVRNLAIAGIVYGSVIGLGVMWGLCMAAWDEDRKCYIDWDAWCE